MKYSRLAFVLTCLLASLNLREQLLGVFRFFRFGKPAPTVQTIKMPSKCQKHEHLFCELVAMQASEKSANQIASGFWRCLQASRQSKTVQRRLPIPTMKRRIPIVPNGFPKQWYKMTVYRFQLPIDSFIPDVKNEQTLISCVRKQARPCSTMVVSTTRFVQIMLTFPGCYVL